MKFSRQLTCYFDQCDPAGILFYGQVFFICHQTIEDFIQHIGIQWNEWFNDPQLAAPVRHSQAEYTLPIRAGEKFKAILHIHRLGASSVGFEVNLVNKDGATCATIRNVHVFIHRETGRKTNIPGIHKDRLHRYLIS